MDARDEIEKVTEQVKQSYGSDEAQNLAVLMLERERDGRLYHHNLKFWAKQRAQRNTRDRLRKELREVSIPTYPDGQSDADPAYIPKSPENQEASVLLTEVLNTRQGKAIYRHLTGEKPIRSRQYLHQLRRELKGRL